MTITTVDWKPFWVDASQRIAPRPLRSPGCAGIADRLRAAAFAEVQAETAFVWAAHHYNDAPSQLVEHWLRLAEEEKKHRFWLLGRLEELGHHVADRPVNDALWRSLTKCLSAREFSHFMAGAEERGRRAGERFHQDLLALDPKTAAIFGQIAWEERSHIEIAYRYFPIINS